MPNIVMNDKQHVAASLTILDKDGEPFTGKPDGSTVEFVSSDPAIVDFTIGDTGLDIDVESIKVGQASISGTVTMADGTTKFTDTLIVTIVNSDPNSANFTVGVPVDET